MDTSGIELHDRWFAADEGGACHHGDKLPVDHRCRARLGHRSILLRRLPQGRRCRSDGRQGARQRFAVRIRQRGDTRIGDGVGGGLRRHPARERRADHVGGDATVVREAAPERVAIALDQARRLRDPPLGIAPDARAVLADDEVETAGAQLRHLAGEFDRLAVSIHRATLVA